VWPLAGRAQQAKLARIGFLGLTSPSSHASRLAHCAQDFAISAGSKAGISLSSSAGPRAITIGCPALTEELVRLNVDVLVTHGAAGALPAKNASSTVPIVITAVGDMLALGLVSSLSHPGGNITGSSLFVAEHTAKRLELIKEAVPSLTKVGVLLNPGNASIQFVLSETEGVAKASNVELRAFEARQPSDFERVFAAMADQHIGALVIHEDTMLNANANALAVFAAARRLPSCGFPEFVRSGGLLAYGINFADMDYRAAAFVDKILKGAKPVDLPVLQPTKFETVINLKTAKALGIKISDNLLSLADEVIE
jgi:putative ABC transport system substrate-binding protein